jgi:molybdopterin synthase catalytic subunit
MPVSVHIIDGPLPGAPPALEAAGAGVVLAFEGIVRGLEEGRPISALDYEVYRPMAERMLAQLGEELLRRHGLLALSVEHSRGRVGVGQCSFRLRIASAHREESLVAMGSFIDRLKQDVPIWKTPVFIASQEEGARV